MADEERDDRPETPEPEPSLVERAEQAEEQEEQSEDRPSDFALGVMLNDLKVEVAGLKASHGSRLDRMEAGLAEIPVAVEEAIQGLKEALLDDTDGQEPGSQPLTSNPGLKWWEKALGGRS